MNRYLIELNPENILSCQVCGSGPEADFKVIQYFGEETYPMRGDFSSGQYWQWWKDATATIKTIPVDICILYSKEAETQGKSFVECGIQEVQEGLFSVTKTSSWTREELERYLAMGRTSSTARRIHSVDAESQQLYLEDGGPLCISILGYEGKLFANEKKAGQKKTSAFSGATPVTPQALPKQKPLVVPPLKDDEQEKDGIKNDQNRRPIAENADVTTTRIAEKKPSEDKLEPPTGREIGAFFKARTEKMTKGQHM